MNSVCLMLSLGCEALTSPYCKAVAKVCPPAYTPLETCPFSSLFLCFTLLLIPALLDVVSLTYQ